MSAESRRYTPQPSETLSPLQIEQGKKVKAWAEGVMWNREENTRLAEDGTRFWITKQIALEKMPGSQLRREVYTPYIGKQTSHKEADSDFTTTTDTTYTFLEDGSIYKLIHKISQLETKNKTHGISSSISSEIAGEKELEELLEQLTQSKPKWFHLSPAQK